MARYLIIPLILIVALAAVLLYVGGAEMISVDLLGKTYETKLQFALLALSVFIGLIIGLWSLLVWLWRMPGRMKSGFGRKRHNHGLDAVEQALLAGASGDGDRALKKAKKARELLSRPALTALISAKAAEVAGDHEDAASHYKTLLDDSHTEAAGLRGLARVAETKGDMNTAIEIAKTAYEPSKGPAWAFDLLFKSQIAVSDWEGALASLDTAQKRKHIDKDQARRSRAALLAAQAAKLEDAGQSERAIEAALRSADMSAGFAPGAALAARLLTKSGDTKKATSILEKAWGRAPHPALALAYNDIYSGEPAKVRAKKLKSLTKNNPAHRESFIFAAEQSLRGGDGVAALQALGGLLREEEPSARLCTLASAAEDKLGNPIDARAWHLRAASAPIEADWSDLDPDGPAFKYEDKDWQRLILSYGESGTLIHPRYEARQRRRSAIALEADILQAAAEPKQQDKKPTPKNLDTPPRPDDPGVSLQGDDKEDLSKRLENLLDGSAKD